MKEITTERGRSIVFVNPCDRDAYRRTHKYVLWVGQICSRYLVIWADSLDTATEHMCDWVVDNAPGLLCDDSMREEYERAIAAGESEESAMQAAEADVTVFGHSGYHGILSDEWGIAMEDPSRAQMLDLLERN